MVGIGSMRVSDAVTYFHLFITVLLTHIVVSECGRGNGLINRDIMIIRPLYNNTKKNGYHNNFLICIHAPLSRDASEEGGSGDSSSYYESGRGQQLLGYELWAQHVNYEKKGFHIGNETWGVELIVMDDLSDDETVSENTQKCLSGEFGRMDWMFAAYTSALTEASLVQTEMSGDLLMASASNLRTVWNPSINSAFTVSFAQGSYFAYSLPLYARNSAKTVISFCGLSSGSNVTLCTVFDLNQLNQSAIGNGMKLVDYVTIDLDSSTYIDDMQNAVDTARSGDVDVVVVNDYSKLCIDIVNYMREINWTPKGLNFVDCIYNSATREAIGEPYIQHSVSQTSFFGEGNYTSGTSGYTPAQLNNLFKLYSGRDIDMDGANAFAAGEIMQAAIEVQAARNASLVTDPAVLSDIIKNGSWSTVLSPGNIIFDASHIAVYDITITQFATNFELVRLEDHETLVYPMPSWMSRECERSTQSCSGHGFCVDESCICEANYYDSSSALKCDSKCHGVIVEGVCRSNRDYYVGVNFYFDTSNFLELEAHARLAIELVNDKSNEWFSNITQQVTIIPRLNNSACDPDTARLALTDQENWVKQISNGTHELDGVIGAFCSSASAAIASQGARKSLPQISPISTLLSLGDKELYPYFSRTCPDNGHNSDALVNVFEDLGLNPYITIVFDITDNAKDFANSVAKEWRERGYTIIGFVPVDGYNFNVAIELIASFGSPLILLCMMEEMSEKVLTSVRGHPVLDSESVVWAKTDWGANTESNRNGTSFLYPKGMISLNIHLVSSNTSDRYLELWKGLDPTLYPDSDGDRSDVTPLAGPVVDAIFSLAMAFQYSINDNTNFDAARLRSYVVEKLHDNVVFEGVTGIVDFTTLGDQVYAAFDVFNYQIDDGIGNWVNIGNVVKNSSTGSYFSRNFNYSDIIWPDGSSGILHNYNEQLEPYCMPGTTATRGLLLACDSCDVGTFKSDYGGHPCAECPTGGDCNNVHVKVPCLLPGYWREQPPDYAMGDFSAYPIHGCDVPSACNGGCEFINSCGSGRLQTSPTCAVCSSGYYQNLVGGCDKCSTIQTVTHVAVSFTLGVLFFIISVTILFYLQIKSDTECAKVAEKNVFSSLLQQMKVHYRKAASTQKLLLSFMQILVGVQFYLKMDWPDRFDGVLTRFSLNLFSTVSGANSCRDVDNYYYYELLMWFMLPFAIALPLLLIVYGVYVVSVKRMEAGDLKAQNVMNLWNLFCKLCLWICLVFFPQLSYIMITYFQCRDFGSMGLFLRVNYEVDCSSTTYDHYSYVAGVGVVLYTVGIPVLFTWVIRNRKHLLFESPSELLYIHYKDEYCYFEIFQLIRKFLLTSVLVFVGEPGQPSMALYLLVVNSIALVLIALFCPYKTNSDNFLSIMLVSVECCMFLVAFLVLSGVSDVDEYNEDNMYSTLYIIIVFSIVVLVPITFVMKFDAASRRVRSIVGHFVDAARESVFGESDAVLRRLSFHLEVGQISPKNRTEDNSFSVEMTKSPLRITTDHDGQDF